MLSSLLLLFLSSFSPSQFSQQADARVLQHVLETNKPCQAQVRRMGEMKERENNGGEKEREREICHSFDDLHDSTFSFSTSTAPPLFLFSLSTLSTCTNTGRRPPLARPRRQEENRTTVRRAEGCRQLLFAKDGRREGSGARARQRRGGPVPRPACRGAGRVRREF